MIKRATDGAGSYVWEFRPSGMMPSNLIRVPPIFSTRLVMGDTVVTTLNRPSDSA